MSFGLVVVLTLFPLLFIFSIRFIGRCALGGIDGVKRQRGCAYEYRIINESMNRCEYVDKECSDARLDQLNSCRPSNRASTATNVAFVACVRKRGGESTGNESHFILYICIYIQRSYLSLLL